MEIDPFVLAFIDSTIKGMRGLVEKGEEVAPQIILFARDGEDPAIIPLLGCETFFVSREGKRKLPIIVKKVWREFSAKNPAIKLNAVVLLSDAWVEHPSEEEFEEMVKNGRKTEFQPKPGMAETLLIMVSLADQELQYSWPYVRGEKEVVFTREPVIKNSPDTSGTVLMNKLWPL